MLRCHDVKFNLITDLLFTILFTDVSFIITMFDHSSLMDTQEIICSYIAMYCSCLLIVASCCDDDILNV